MMSHRSPRTAFPTAALAAACLVVSALDAQSLVADLAAGGSGTPADFVEWRGKTWCQAFEFVSNPTRLYRRLWRSDGTAAGTVSMTPPGQQWRFVLDLTPMSGQMFFAVEDDASGRELWVTDGTQAGTRQVLDIGPRTLSGQVQQLVAVGDVVYFVAAGAEQTPLGLRYEWNRELWRSDGTAAGTRMVVDLTPGWASRWTNLSELTEFGGELFFLANPDGLGTALWRSDGTAAGTAMVIRPSSIRQLTALGPWLYFFVGGDLWRTDGTANGTALLATGLFRNMWGGETLIYLTSYRDLHAWNGSQALLLATLPGIGFETPIGDLLWFRGSDTTHGSEPWVSDGTVAGTRRVADIAPGVADGMDFPDRYSDPHVFEPAGSDGRVLFTGNDGTGMQVWVTDGTAAGTRALTGFTYALSSQGPVDYHRHGAQVFFRNYDTAGDMELWTLPVSLTGAPLAEPFGVGCGSGTNAAPRIDSAGMPRLGDPSFAVTLEGARPLSAAALLIGIDRSSFAWDSCGIAVDPILPGPAFQTDAAGHAVLSAAVPANPALLGARFTAQWGVLDPSGGFLGVATLSEGLLVVVGS